VDAATAANDGLAAATSAAVDVFDKPLPFDPAMLAHALSTLEGRLLIVTLLGLAGAGRASGIGAVDFAQPLLVGCRSSLRMAFAPVRLVPCAAGAALQGAAGAVGDASTQAGRIFERIRRSGSSDPRSRPRLISALEARARREPPAAAPFVRAWPTAGGAGMLLRLVVSVLAALSAMLAGAAGLERERRARKVRQYRRRLHS
jgi:hypothetical protein